MLTKLMEINEQSVQNNPIIELTKEEQIDGLMIRSSIRAGQGPGVVPSDAGSALGAKYGDVSDQGRSWAAPGGR